MRLTRPHYFGEFSRDLKFAMRVRLQVCSSISSNRSSIPSYTPIFAEDDTLELFLIQPRHLFPKKRVIRKIFFQRRQYFSRMRSIFFPHIRDSQQNSGEGRQVMSALCG